MHSDYPLVTCTACIYLCSFVCFQLLLARLLLLNAILRMNCFAQLNCTDRHMLFINKKNERASMIKFLKHAQSYCKKCCTYFLQWHYRDYVALYKLSAVYAYSFLFIQQCVEFVYGISSIYCSNISYWTLYFSIYIALCWLVIRSIMNNNHVIKMGWRFSGQRSIPTYDQNILDNNYW